MGTEDREILLDDMLDRTLARYANTPVPPGLEKRILAKLERRTTRSRRRIEAACVVAAAALCVMPVLLRVHSGNPVAPVAAANYTHTADWSPVDYSSLRLESAPADSPKPAPGPGPAAGMEKRSRKSTLIADFQIEPVELSELRMSSLSIQ